MLKKTIVSDISWIKIQLIQYPNVMYAQIPQGGGTLFSKTNQYCDVQTGILNAALHARSALSDLHNHLLCEICDRIF